DVHLASGIVGLRGTDIAVVGRSPSTYWQRSKKDRNVAILQVARQPSPKPPSLQTAGPYAGGTCSITSRGKVETITITVGGPQIPLGPSIRYLGPAHRRQADKSDHPLSKTGQRKGSRGGAGALTKDHAPTLAGPEVADPGGGSPPTCNCPACHWWPAACLIRRATYRPAGNSSLALLADERTRLYGRRRRTQKTKKPLATTKQGGQEKAWGTSQTKARWTHRLIPEYQSVDREETRRV
ncbi:unnamed protein product, partial [Trichogramma brassicae]